MTRSERWDGKLASLGKHHRAGARHRAPLAPKPAVLGATEPVRRVDVTPYALNYDDTARYLGVSRWSVEEMVRDGRLKPVAVGARKIFRRADLEAFVDEAVGAAYRIPWPKNIAEAHAAAADCTRQANEMLRQSHDAAASPEVRSYTSLAARSFAGLAVFFRWNAGELDEQHVA